MKRITLIRTPSGWIADFHDDQTVITAFGCSTVPTAFTASAPAGTVLAAISRLNPGHVVEVGVPS